MIDISTEECLPLKQLANELPVERSYRTLLRYIHNGVRKKSSKEIVKLEFIRVGGEVYSSKEAFFRFLNRINDQSLIVSGS